MNQNDGMKNIIKQKEKMAKFDNKVFKIYNAYWGLRTWIFLFNIFILIMIFTNHPILLILSIIFNIIYLLIYNRRFLILIGSLVFGFIYSKDKLVSISLGLCIGNSISYIIDFIHIKINSFLFNSIDKIDKKLK